MHKAPSYAVQTAVVHSDSKKLGWELKHRNQENLFKAILDYTLLKLVYFGSS